MSLRRIEILGKGCTADIYDASYDHLHPPPCAEAFYEDEEEQTFDDFVEIGKRNPNSKGTGRWKLNRNRRKICVYEFVKRREDLQEDSRFSHLAPFLSVFLNIPVEFKRITYAIDYEKEKFQLEGHEASECRTWQERKTKKKKSSKDVAAAFKLDVFGLFDSLIALATPPYISIVALFNEKLGEEGDRGECFDVLGRACGDRVSVCSIIDCSSRRELYATVTHELLHTIGFDHCNSFKCLMNAISTAEEGTIFLSPVNLRKLKEFHGIEDDNGQFIMKRYEKLLEFLQEMGVEFAGDCSWLEKKIQAVKKTLRAAGTV